MKKVIITGVSTGIGYSSAKILCNSGYMVFGSVRNEKDADRLSLELGKNFHPLIFDVTNKDQIISEYVKVKSSLKEGECIRGLVNNAGIALGGPVSLIDTEVFRKQFDVNFFGLIDVTKIFLPLLGIEKGTKIKGKIINISSVSGKRAYPFVAPYSSSKFALEAFSDSLRRELLLYGIDVILIEPGPIKTAIWNKTPDPNNNQFIGSDYELPLKRFYKLVIEMGKKGLEPDVIGNRVKFILENKNPSARHIITPNKFLNYTIASILPTRLYDKIMAKGFGMLDKKKSPF